METKDVGDLVAGSAILGAYLSLLPEIAALLAIFWTLIRIYEWIDYRFIRKRKGEFYK